MLPSLNALRAFEAASRLRSFAQASDELRVTPGAISRHIHILEESLGIKLFTRVPRGVELTPIGERYLGSIQDVFRTIDSATRTISQRCGRPSVQISGAPTLIARWLMPRLHRFEDLYPDSSITVVTSDNPVDFASGPIDLALEPNENTAPSMRSIRLFDFELVPVCSPVKVNGHAPPGGMEDLGRHAILHTVNPPGLWRYWARQTGFEGLETLRNMSFQTSDLACRAASEGLGVALFMRRLIGPELASGLLCVPFDKEVTYPGGYFINAPIGRLRQPAVAQFFEWLVAEARREPHDDCLARLG